MLKLPFADNKSKAHNLWLFAEPTATNMFSLSARFVAQFICDVDFPTVTSVEATDNTTSSQQL